MSVSFSVSSCDQKLLALKFSTRIWWFWKFTWASNFRLAIAFEMPSSLGSQSIEFHICAWILCSTYNNIFSIFTISKLVAGRTVFECSLNVYYDLYAYGTLLSAKELNHLVLAEVFLTTKCFLLSWQWHKAQFYDLNILFPGSRQTCQGAEQVQVRQSRLHRVHRCPG